MSDNVLTLDAMLAAIKEVQALPRETLVSSSILAVAGEFLRVKVGTECFTIGHPDTWAQVQRRTATVSLRDGGQLAYSVPITEIDPPTPPLPPALGTWVGERERILDAVLPVLLLQPDVRERLIAFWKSGAAR